MDFRLTPDRVTRAISVGAVAPGPRALVDTMRTKLIALALAVTVAIGTGGIVAAHGVSSDGADTHGTTTTSTPTTEAGGYEFAVADQGDWFSGDRADARETVAALVAADDAADDRLGALFDEGDRLRMDVYGALQSDDDSAHVRVYPDRSSATGDPRPLLELTVDLETETVEVVGVSTDPVEADDARSADESTAVDLNDSTVSVSPDGHFELDRDRTDTTLDTDAAVDLDVPSENITRNGSIVRFDLPADAATVTVGDDIEIVDEADELTNAEIDRIRSHLANDSDARASLRDRFGDDTTVVLSVGGVDPSGDVHMDATAPGDNPETAVVVDRTDGDVSVESAHLLTADQFSATEYDVENVEQAP